MLQERFLLNDLVSSDVPSWSSVERTEKPLEEVINVLKSDIVLCWHVQVISKGTKLLFLIRGKSNALLLIQYSLTRYGEVIYLFLLGVKLVQTG